MKHCKLAFLGFGHVNQALASLLLKKQAEIKVKDKLSFTVTGIATGSHGSAVDTTGIDLEKALRSVESGDSLNPLSTPSNPVKETIEFIRCCEADVLFEAIPVNYTNGQPALDHIRTALQSGIHVVSANKGPVVFGYNELTELAGSKGLKYRFESAVMDGVPIFSMFREILPVVEIKGFQGILNSTTNLILTQMENGSTFEEALRYAQSIGVAESDPAGDIDGWDSAVKVSALATVLMDAPTTPQMVKRSGIKELTLKDIKIAKKEGKRWKLICEAVRLGDQVECRVAPQKVGIDSQFYPIEGTSSIIQFETEILGKLTILEEDSDLYTTAYGMLADFLNVVK